MSCARRLLLLTALVALTQAARAETYYVDPRNGDDSAKGNGIARPWRTLQRAQKVKLGPGDSLLLAAGVRHRGRLFFENLSGTGEKPILIGSYVQPGGDPRSTALIDGRGTPGPLGLRNSSHVRIENLTLSADGGPLQGEMRCGLLVEATGGREYRGISLSRLHVVSVSFHPPGFVRPPADVRTPNGTGRYGWGIRFMVRPKQTAVIRDIAVRDCVIERVDHTGLKFTAPVDGIRDVVVENVLVSNTGGPGIQMSGLAGGRFSSMTVDGSGSTQDTRNWGRGSGLWTWSSSDIVIERSRFMNANGPGDSAGVHIDYNCRDVVVQHNLSANNAGGFCEILGNNYNCAYRYNVSINDGHRVKGRAGAFQEGKIFWLSGYVGKGKRTGPFNSYFYNNTVYVGEGIEAKIAVGSTAQGVLVANNIFHITGRSSMVAGDQNQPDRAGADAIGRVVFQNNLFLRADNWPEGVGMNDASPVIGDPRFANPGGTNIKDYIPMDGSIVKDRGIEIPLIPGDKIGLKIGLPVATDVLGNPIVGKPDLGAIELQ